MPPVNNPWKYKHPNAIGIFWFGMGITYLLLYYLKIIREAIFAVLRRSLLLGGGGVFCYTHMNEVKFFI